MQSKGSTVDCFIDYLRKDGVVFNYKQNNRLFRIIGIFSKRFNERVTTTIGNTIYFPSRIYEKHPLEIMKLLAHEYVHVIDQRRNKTFYFTYLLPQSLAIFSLFSIFGILNPVFYSFLWFLIALFPWKSKHRSDWELRAYSITMATEFWLKGKIQEQTITEIINSLGGKLYYKRTNIGLLTRVIEYKKDLILKGEIQKEDQLFQELYDIIQKIK